jgi:tetratricopeptide (TPR) repeat protein
MGNYLIENGEISEAGGYYKKALDAAQTIYDQSGTAAALRDLSVSYNKMGNYLIENGEISEAGGYYKKALDARREIYDQSGTAAALWDIVISLDKIGDNAYAQGDYEEARTHRIKAWELFKTLVEVNPTKEKHTTYLKNKAMINDTESV